MRLPVTQAHAYSHQSPHRPRLLRPRVAGLCPWGCLGALGHGLQLWMLISTSWIWKENEILVCTRSPVCPCSPAGMSQVFLAVKCVQCRGSMAAGRACPGCVGGTCPRDFLVYGADGTGAVIKYEHSDCTVWPGSWRREISSYQE